MTFPGGTHDLWLRYWLAAGGIDPDKDVSTIVVPPPQMVANMKVGNMDVFCVGEPWNEQLVHQGIGFTAATTGELWKGHPEKALGLRADFVDKNPNAAKAILMAVMEAQQWCDAMENKDEMAAIIGKRQWMNVPTRRHHRPPQGRHRLRQRPRRHRHRPLHEILEGRRVLPVQEPRHLVPRREHPLGQVRARPPTSRRWSIRSTARICGARRPRTSASPQPIFRHRRRAASRPSSTARSSIPTNPSAYLDSLTIKASA